CPRRPWTGSGRRPSRSAHLERPAARNPAPTPPPPLGTAAGRVLPDAATGSASGGLPNPAASWASSILLPPHVDHLLYLLLILRLELAELSEERLLQNLVTGFRRVVEQVVG